jgi:hypothetical protein
MLDTSMSKAAPTPRPKTSAFAWLRAREPQVRAGRPERIDAGELPCAGVRSGGHAAQAAAAPAPYVPHPRLAGAHAAFATVEGGGPRALDAALGVVEAESLVLRMRLLAQEEALKLLRLYATDKWARSVAEKALAAPQASLAPCLPGYLYDPSLAERGACHCGERR